MRATTHNVQVYKSPLRFSARCDCGWSHNETRRQNALARSAKLRGAIRRHWKAEGADTKRPIVI